METLTCIPAKPYAVDKRFFVTQCMRNLHEWGGRPLALSLANFCDEDVTIESITIHDVHAQFALAGLPPLPMDLEEGMRHEIDVTFVPESTAEFEGYVEVAYTRGETTGVVTVPLAGNGLKDRVDVFGPPKFDVLFVVGNSSPISKTVMNWSNVTSGGLPRLTCAWLALMSAARSSPYRLAVSSVWKSRRSFSA